MKKNIKILHIGSNIANNVYLNTLFLREKGYIADAISPDYDHPISTPEWEQANINPKKINKILESQNIQGIDPNYKRPSWYSAGPLQRIAQNQYNYQNNFSVKLIKKEFSNRRLNYLICDTNEKWVNFTKKINPYYSLISIREYFYYKTLIKKFKKIWPERRDQLSINDIIPYVSHVRILKHIFARYNLVQCYSTNAIFALLTNKRPYIAFEHGTIRDLPFTNSPEGRLTALSYRLANHVFVTNNDNIAAAKKLGIKNYTAMPHPINDYWYKKLKSDNTDNRVKLIFCPSRHDWSIKGNEIFIRAIPGVAKNSVQPFKFVFINWGNDSDKSKKLVKTLKVEKYVSWIGMLTKKHLVETLYKSDIILDQMILPCMGAIAPEGLQAGKPVLTSYKQEVNKWSYPIPPPLVTVNSTQDTIKELSYLLNHPRKIKEIGKKSKEWFKKYHSKKVVVKKLLKEYDKISNE